MKRLAALLSCIFIGIGCIPVAAEQPAKTYQVFIAENGDDNAEGTIEKPLATLDAARRKVRERRASLDADTDICIYFRGGEYYMPESVFFDQEDSGTKEHPITISAYEKETVNIVGSPKIDPSLVTDVKDASILDRIIDKDAASKVKQIDLSSMTDSIAGFWCKENGTSASQFPFEVYCGDAALTPARWPNKEDGGYVKTKQGSLKATEDGKQLGVGKEAEKRIALWSDKAAEDLYIRAYFSYEYNNEVYKADSLDRAAGTFCISGNKNSAGDWNVVSAGRRYYFFNLPEEIDKPGECYIDYDTRIVYFYPPDDFSADALYMTGDNCESLLTFRDAAHYVIHGINFLYLRKNAVDVRSSDTRYYDMSDVREKDFTVSDCKIAHTSWNAMTFYGTGITVKNCEIYDVASGAISYIGGDRKTLTPGNSRIENCHIYRANRNERTYQPLISANSFGMVISHNTVSDAVHELIGISSADIIIEYNEFSNAVTETSDMGAIYFGRDPSLMGTVIRYNYFHDIGNTYGSTGQQSVYVDDGNAPAEIYGNIFVNAAGKNCNEPGAIKTHGAQFCEIYNNIFVDTPYAYSGASWGGDGGDRQILWYEWLYDRAPSKQHSIRKKVQDIGFDCQAWRDHYAGTIWAKIYDYLNYDLIEKYNGMSSAEFGKCAKENAPIYSNNVTKNVMVNTKEANSLWGVNYTLKDNVTDLDASIFVGNGDYSLTADGLAMVQAKIPDFQPIDFSAIGCDSGNYGEWKPVDETNHMRANLDTKEEQVKAHTFTSQTDENGETIEVCRDCGYRKGDTIGDKDNKGTLSTILLIGAAVCVLVTLAGIFIPKISGKKKNGNPAEKTGENKS